MLWGRHDESVATELWSGSPFNVSADSHLCWGIVNPAATICRVTSDPAPVPPALQQRSRVTHERLFAAGTRLLEEGGEEALTVAAVADAAGLSVGSVYRRFGDKERLLAAIQTRFTDEFREEFRQRVADTGLSASTPAAEVITSAVVG